MYLQAHSGQPDRRGDATPHRPLQWQVSEHLVAGLWDAGRPMVAKEFAQTMAVELSLKDMTAKKRVGGALDDEDAQLPIWVGQIPMKTTFGTPIPNPECADMPLPDYIKKIVESN